MLALWIVVNMCKMEEENTSRVDRDKKRASFIAWQHVEHLNVMGMFRGAETTISFHRSSRT